MLVPKYLPNKPTSLQLELEYIRRSAHLNHIPLTTRSDSAINHSRMEVALASNSTNEPAIHRLVDDILEDIFLLNATLPDPELQHATTLASSQVCTRWRSIALNCHTIWCLIIDYRRHSLKWIETLLDRSNPSPLDLGSQSNLVQWDNGGQGVLELVFDHINRLRIFNVYVNFSSWELVCSRFLQMPAPNLEVFHIISQAAGGYLTHPLFNNHAPNLRSLSLSRCMIDFTSPVLTSLTELYVHLLEENTLPTVLDWLNIFGRMPSLRSVRLRGGISSGLPTDSFPVIHLDALDMLEVEGLLHECVALLKHLIVPLCCGLDLTCDGTHQGFDQRQLWTIIEKKIDSWAKNPYRRLNVTAFSGFVNVGNLPREDISKEVDTALSISLELSNVDETASLFHSLFSLFKRTFFDTTSFRIFDNDRFGTEAVTPSVDNFREFVNLEELFLRKEYLPRILFPFLQHTNPVLLPSIKTFHFRSVTFQDGSDSILLQLADFLQWRREQGFPVQKIVIVADPYRINRDYILSHIQGTVVEIVEIIR